MKPGKGDLVVNDKPVDVFFSRETGRMIVRQPLELTNHAQTFDIMVNVAGGGESGQAEGGGPRRTRRPLEYDAPPETPTPQRGRLHPRAARDRGHKVVRAPCAR